MEIQINKNALLTKSDYVVEELLKNFEVCLIKVKKKFFPETGAFNHENKSLN